MDPAGATAVPTIRSMGYGALLGSGVFGTSYVLFPFVRRLLPSFTMALVLGALLGGGLHGLLAATFKLLIQPAGKYVDLFWRLGVIVFLRQMDFVNDDKAAALVQTAVDKSLGK